MRHCGQNEAMRPSLALASKREHILALAAARGASKRRVFGSTERGQDQEGSDLDLLIDMPAGTSLRQINGLQLDIQDALGIKGKHSVDPYADCAARGVRRRG